jgi:spermidine synthase
MLIPTTLMGATFPIVSRRITKGMEEMGRKVGDAYSVNTLGAIVGSLAAGFLLIPLVGIKWASFTGGLINIAVGLSIIFIARAFRLRAFAVFALLAVITGGFAASQAEMKTPYLTFYQAGKFKESDLLKEAEREMEILFTRDYAEGHVTAYRVGGLFTVQHRGRSEGTGRKEMPNTVMLAALPAASFSQKPKDALLIGLGSGVTAMAGKNLVRNLEAVEINPGVAEVVEKFGFPGTLDGVKVHITDGRRYLTYTDRKYDIIITGVSVPSEAMSANLFTREFYEIVASRLKEGGVFSQHLPAWIMTKGDARSCFKTFVSVFDNAYAWLVSNSGDFILLGGKGPIDTGEVARRSLKLAASVFPVQWKANLQIDEREMESFFKLRLVRDAGRMKETLAMKDIAVITDDRPFLEFAVTKNLLLGPYFRNYRE